MPALQPMEVSSSREERRNKRGGGGWSDENDFLSFNTGPQSNKVFVLSFAILFASLMLLFIANVLQSDHQAQEQQKSKQELQQELLEKERMKQEAEMLSLEKENKENQKQEQENNYLDDLDLDPFDVPFLQQHLPRPTDLTIVMIGDYFLRYSYLSLVYYLQYGRWYNCLEDPINIGNGNGSGSNSDSDSNSGSDCLVQHHLFNDTSFQSPFHDQPYNEFAYQTSLMFQPNEICDCFVNIHRSNMPKYAYHNRYYYNKQINMTVIYFDADYFHGRWLPNDEGWKSSLQRKFGVRETRFTTAKWEFPNIVDFVTNHVAKEQPTHVIINGKPKYMKNEQGDDLSLSLQSSLDKIVSSKSSSNYFWMTAPNVSDEKQATKEEQQTIQQKQHDVGMCELFQNCIDLEWTKQVPSDYYLTESTFKEPIYRLINEQILEQMKALPEDYAKYDPKNVLGK